MPAYKLIETQTATGLQHWACYFINGDASGMEEADIAEADAWLAFHQPEETNRHASVSDVSGDDSDHIGRFYDCHGKAPSYGLLCNLATYTLLVYETES
jgi:hypothetical protein